MTNQNRKHQDPNPQHNRHQQDPNQHVDKERQGSGPSERDREDDRYRDERVNRDRGVREQANQGHGPMNVGDQSRTRD
jgi:hypothetical protein